MLKTPGCHIPQNFLAFGTNITFVDLSLIIKEGKFKAINFISYSLQPTYLVIIPFKSLT